LKKVIVIGGGLAGCEAAWQAAGRGAKVTLCEMKPKRYSEAHKECGLAELVCSNSDKISDIEANKLARDIALRVEQELKYPGEIKIMVIRENRVIEFAR